MRIRITGFQNNWLGCDQVTVEGGVVCAWLYQNNEEILLLGYKLRESEGVRRTEEGDYEVAN